MAAAKCKVCAAHEGTIAAQQQTIQALMELVNTQREFLSPSTAAPAPEPERLPGQPPQLTLASSLPLEVDVDEIAARLAAGVDDPQVADRLMAELQATGQLAE